MTVLNDVELDHFRNLLLGAMTPSKPKRLDARRIDGRKPPEGEYVVLYSNGQSPLRADGSSSGGGMLFGHDFGNDEIGRVAVQIWGGFTYVPAKYFDAAEISPRSGLGVRIAQNIVRIYRGGERIQVQLTEPEAFSIAFGISNLAGHAQEAQSAIAAAREMATLVAAPYGADFAALADMLSERAQGKAVAPFSRLGLGEGGARH